MSEATTQPATTEQPRSTRTWQTSDYEAALARLENMQTQIDLLRSTLPSLVAPLVRERRASSKAGDGDAKAAIFADVRTAACGANDGIARLRGVWEDPESGEVLARARESLSRDADLEMAGREAPFGWAGGKGG